MLIQSTPPLHLTYCMNVHASESLADVYSAVENHVLKVKERVRPGNRFGLGLRLGWRACNELAGERALAAFRAFLDKRDLYVFTINGFPYDRFQGARVKERVYAPDWRDPARRDYTVQLAHILARLLPEGVTGSISTVPGSFRAWIQTECDVKAMVANLVVCAEKVATLCEQQRCSMVIALEPEPACWLETTPETIVFFQDCMPDWTRPYLGLCLDTCHMAVQFEDPVVSLEAVRRAGLRLGKIQLGAAIEVHDPRVLPQLRDETYLHQTKWRRANGSEYITVDVPAEAPVPLPGDRARVHFHVPLYAAGGDGWTATSRDLSDAFFAAIRAGATEHVEVETYTFDLLPEAWREKDVDESMARELLWAAQRLQSAF